LTASLNLSPVTPDFFVFSDPAKSTKFILKLNFSFVFKSYFSTLNIKIACDLDETSFDHVENVVLFVEPLCNIL